jgi:hypothetical protein
MDWQDIIIPIFVIVCIILLGFVRQNNSADPDVIDSDEIVIWPNSRLWSQNKNYTNLFWTGGFDSINLLDWPG